MTKSDIIKEFNRVYPEFHPTILETTEKTGIVEANFPDGTFYFIIMKNVVSTSYNTFDAAKARLQKELEL